jgi:hypothetical protein
MEKKAIVLKPQSIPSNKPGGQGIIKGGVPTMQNPPQPPPKKTK